MKILCILALMVTILAEPGFSEPNTKKKSNYVVRALVIVDNSLYSQRWNRIHDDNITCYYETVIKGVEKRFKTIEDAKIKFQISDVIVMKDSSQKGRIVIFRPIYFGKIEYIVSIPKTRAAFEEWEKNNKKKLKDNTYNVVLIYTKGVAVAGTYAVTATFESFCKQSRTIIYIADKGLFNTIDATAHGLGYSLGASRDGINNDCQPNDNYIMTYRRLQVDGSFHDNRLKFSNCSSNYINDYLRNLKTNDYCVKSKIKSKPSKSKCGIINAGVNFPIREQCTFAVGWYSEPCMNNYKSEDNVCKELQCYSRSISSCTKVFPVEATSCGINKWCKEGKCVNRTKKSIDLKKIEKCWNIEDNKMSQGATTQSCYSDDLMECLDYCKKKLECKALNFNPFGIKLVISKYEIVESSLKEKKGIMTFLLKSC